MLDYLEEYGYEEYGSDPEEIESTMLSLTDGAANSKWDKELKQIGVKVPKLVRQRNLEQEAFV